MASYQFQGGSIRIDNSKGQADRVVYFSLDADKALHQWRYTQPSKPRTSFQAPQPGTPLSVAPSSI